MVVKRRRKKNKLRGQRTHGGGGTKNRRGAGSRGGVGRAGSHKHKFSKYYLDFGVKRTLKAKKKSITINVEEIQERIEEWLAIGKVKNENGIIIVDGKNIGFGKVLGRGTIAKKIKIENASLTKKAAEKITGAGGQITEAQEIKAAKESPAGIRRGEGEKIEEKEGAEAE